MVLHDLIPLVTGDLPGWMPLAVAIVLFVALAWLWGSMRIHLKRADYPDEQETPDADTDAAPEAVASSPSSPGSASQA